MGIWQPGRVARAMLLLALLAGAGDALSHEGHEHAPAPAETPGAGPTPEAPPTWPGWLGKLHPASVHLPIGLLLGAALAELLFAFTGRDPFLHAGRFALRLGALGALRSAPLGWLYATSYEADPAWLLEAHRWVGTATAAWAAVVVLLEVRARRPGRLRATYRAGLTLLAALVTAAGFLGGSLVYGLDHFAW